MFDEINAINPNSEQEKSGSIVTDNIFSEESLLNDFDINSSNNFDDLLPKQYETTRETA